MTPFEGYILIKQGNESLLTQALTTYTLDPNTRFKMESLLSTTIKTNSPNLLQLLLHHGGNPDLVSYENGRHEPAIITAVRYKSLTCVQILLAFGARLNKTNFYGTDAIFQAVHENAFDILDYLLEHHQQEDVPPSMADSLYVQPRPHSIVIPELKEAREEKTSCKDALKIKDASHNKRHDDNDYNTHVLCPFYYALNHSLSYSCKRQSLLRLLQACYKCKCLQEIGNCTKSIGQTMDPISSSPSHFPPTGAAKLTGQNYQNSCKTEQVENDEDKSEIRTCLTLAFALNQTKKLPSTAFVAVDDDNKDSDGNAGTAAAHQGNLSTAVSSGNTVVDFVNGQDIKLLNEFNYPYKVYKIEGKCHVIKENESSATTRPSSSYVVLMGPFSLSCITREAIRNFLSISNPEVSVAPGKVDAKVALTSADKRNFQKKLHTLMIPSSLKSFILYKNMSQLKSIKLMKKDYMLNINYFAVYVW